MAPTDPWQQLQTQIEGNLIYRDRDDRGELFVVDHQERRYLYFGAPFEQSCIHKDKPYQPVHEYARAMLLVLGFREPASVLMLGLGGGSLLHAVNRANPVASITVIEWRQAVVEIARHYFQLSKIPDVDIVVADAKQQVRALPAGGHDLIFADLFHDAQVHVWQTHAKFVAQCHRLLSDQGWLVINFDQPLAPDSPTRSALLEVFPQVYSLITRDGNNVILAGRDMDFQWEQCLPGLQRVAQQLEIRFDSILNQIQPLTA